MENVNQISHSQYYMKGEWKTNIVFLFQPQYGTHKKGCVFKRQVKSVETMMAKMALLKKQSE